MRFLSSSYDASVDLVSRLGLNLEISPSLIFYLFGYPHSHCSFVVNGQIGLKHNEGNQELMDGVRRYVIFLHFWSSVYLVDVHSS
jgi:hypothetical protein